MKPWELRKVKLNKIMTYNQLSETIENKLLQLSGQISVYIKFLNTGEIISHNENLQVWAASVIKVPIACTFYKHIHETKLDENTYIEVKQENRVEGTGIIHLLNNEDKFTLLDLATLMLAVSDNAATNELVDLVGWESVEKYMVELGLTQTTFRHKMLIKAGRGPNLTTAKEMAMLLEKLHDKKLTGAQEILNLMKEEKDRTRMPLFLPNDIEIAHKTGSLPEAVHDIGIIYATQPFIFSFLSDDQKDKIKTTMTIAECVKDCFDFAA